MSRGRNGASLHLPYDSGPLTRTIAAEATTVCRTHEMPLCERSPAKQERVYDAPCISFPRGNIAIVASVVCLLIWEAGRQ